MNVGKTKETRCFVFMPSETWTSFLYTLLHHLRILVQDLGSL